MRARRWRVDLADVQARQAAHHRAQVARMAAAARLPLAAFTEAHGASHKHETGPSGKGPASTTTTRAGGLDGCVTQSA